MAVILGYSFYDNAVFDDDLPSIRDIQYAEFGQSILDEINLKEKSKELVNQTLLSVDDFSYGTNTDLSVDSTTPNLINNIDGLTFNDIEGVTFEMIKLTKF
jgi:hypothetical protein